MLKGYDNVEMW